MIIPIHYRVRYRNYPYAPKATRSSKLLGGLFCWPMLLVLGFLWAAILAAVLDSLRLFSGYDTAAWIAFLSLLPAGFVLFKWRKRKMAKIDQAAALETQLVLSMSPAERQDYEKKLAKDALRAIWLILGGIVLLFVIIYLALEVL